MLEIARILKPRGLCCIIAPSSGPEHRFLRDCWRIFSDGFSAVARYAGLEVLDVQTQWGDLPDYDSESNKWHDSVLIARKPVLPLGAKLRWWIYTRLKRLVPPPAPIPETIIQIFHSTDGLPQRSQFGLCPHRSRRVEGCFHRPAAPGRGGAASNRFHEQHARDRCSRGRSLD